MLCRQSTALWNHEFVLWNFETTTATCITEIHINEPRPLILWWLGLMQWQTTHMREIECIPSWVLTLGPDWITVVKDRHASQVCVSHTEIFKGRHWRHKGGEPDHRSLHWPAAFITKTSQWARWRLKSPASRLFTQAFIQTQIKGNIKAPRHWPLCGEFKGPVTLKMVPFDDAIMFINHRDPAWWSLRNEQKCVV